jgi:hypothetical protein
MIYSAFLLRSQKRPQTKCRSKGGLDWKPWRRQQVPASSKNHHRQELKKCIKSRPANEIKSSPAPVSPNGKTGAHLLISIVVQLAARSRSLPFGAAAGFPGY